MSELVVDDFIGLDLGDKRRIARFVKMINNVVSRPSSSIPQQNDGWYDTKASYHFFSNQSIAMLQLEQAIQSYGGSQLAGIKKVLVAHDFCQISYNGLDACEGLGYLANADARGIITYNSIAISPEGLPLSLLYQHTYNRPLVDLGKSAKRKTTLFEDKESYNWHKGMSAVNETLGNDVHKIHIADREADIYELFVVGLSPNTDLLIRSIHNRKLGSEQAGNNSEADHLWDKLFNSPIAAQVVLSIPAARSTKQVEIEVSIRYEKVVISKPAGSKSKQDNVVLTAILLQQISPKMDWQDEIVEWKLLTSLLVESLADALQCVKWYCYRWLIERFHYVLKSGTEIEKLQLGKATSLQKAIHVYSIAAMEMMKLTYLARVSPTVSCELVLTKEQWSVLYMLIHKQAILSQEPPTMEEAVKWMGKLGGHLGRKSDGHPGLKVIWRGYRRMMDAVELYNILPKEKFG